MNNEFRRRIKAISVRDNLRIRYMKETEEKDKIEVSYINSADMVYKWINNTIISGKPVGEK